MSEFLHVVVKYLEARKTIFNDAVKGQPLSSDKLAVVTSVAEDYTDVLYPKLF